MIKFKYEKETLIARDEIQAAAFLKQGFEFATKADEAKYNGKEEEKED